MLNLFATDHRNRCILHIRDSEMVVATSALDVQLIGRRLTILAEESGLALSMSFDPPNKVSIDRYHVNVGGVVVDVDNDKVVFAGTTGQQLTVQGNGSIAANVGIAYGDVPRGLSVAVRAG